MWGKSMVKAIIFDMDGTLYDYDRCNIIAEKRLFEVISLKFDISESFLYNIN
jgi:FMN phosphatase YigB (HAD superfamily)